MYERVTSSISRASYYRDASLQFTNTATASHVRKDNIIRSVVSGPFESAALITTVIVRSRPRIRDLELLAKVNAGGYT